MKIAPFLVVTLAACHTQSAGPTDASANSVDGGGGDLASSDGSMMIVPANAEADWQTRISGPGVVWYNDFRSDDEVNAFRWTEGYNGGNDPKAVGSTIAGNVHRITTDGITGACLEIIRPGGTDDGSVWWRPFSPIVGGTSTGNGRGAGNDDPGANHTITPQAYAATDGGSEISNWPDHGYYGNMQYWSVSPGVFDGTEYYIQMRAKIDPNRIVGANADTDVGKFLYLTRTDLSATPQEIVVFSGHAIMGSNYFSMYRSVGPPLDEDPPGIDVAGNQPGQQFGTIGDKLCRFDNDSGRLANCWKWPADASQWTTLMWHVRPGTGGALGSGDSNNDTLVETFMAAAGEKSYTRIWSEPGVALPFDVQYGHNAIILSTYQNGANLPTQFYHRYAQIIFSKQPIPCPQY